MRYGVFADFFPIFADFFQIFAFFCKFWQILANFGKMFGLIFRARWAIFRILTQNLEKLDPGAVFAPRECFFRIPRVFSHQFGRIFVDFRAIWLGRFRPVFLFPRSVSCTPPNKKKHAILQFCKAFTPHPNMTTLQYSLMTGEDAAVPRVQGALDMRSHAAFLVSWRMTSHTVRAIR